MAYMDAVARFFIYLLYMTVNINNKPTETTATTLSELASELGMPERGVAMAIDNKMVPRVEWGSTPLSDGANVIVIKAACGG